MKTYVLIMCGDFVEATVIRAYNSLEDAEADVKKLIKQDKKDGFKEGEYRPTLQDMFYSRYVLVKDEGEPEEEEIRYEIWDVELV